MNAIAIDYTSWASQKTDNVSESSCYETAFTSQDLKIGSADPDTTLHIHQKDVYEEFYLISFFSESISPTYPRTLHSTNISTQNSCKNRRSRSR